MILRQDRHKEVLFLLFDFLYQEALIMSLNQGLSSFCTGLFETLGECLRVVERKQTLSKHILAHSLAKA